jgi:hypothetical protein
MLYYWQTKYTTSIYRPFFIFPHNRHFFVHISPSVLWVWKFPFCKIAFQPSEDTFLPLISNLYFCLSFLFLFLTFAKFSSLLTKQYVQFETTLRDLPNMTRCSLFRSFSKVWISSTNRCQSYRPTWNTEQIFLRAFLGNCGCVAVASFLGVPSPLHLQRRKFPISYTARRVCCYGNMGRY